uniref:Uncharacterized protein n=1 Tax=Anguilla anguilla TaxID=7936 RepID=A0A0E9QH74_ANGAN
MLDTEEPLLTEKTQR